MGFILGDIAIPMLKLDNDYLENADYCMVLDLFLIFVVEGKWELYLHRGALRRYCCRSTLSGKIMAILWLKTAYYYSNYGLITKAFGFWNTKHDYWSSCYREIDGLKRGAKC